MTSHGTAKVADRRWRLQHSIWLLGPALGLGIITFASFLYIGIRTRHRPWLIAAGIYGVLAVFIMVAFGGSPSEPGAPTPPIQNVGGVVMLITWVGGFVHAAMANRQYLPMLAQQQPWHAKYAPSPSRGVSQAPAVSGDAASSLGLTQDHGEYWGAPAQSPAGDPRGGRPSPETTPAAPNHASQVPPPTPKAAPRDASLADTDLNAASERELAALPGIGPVLAKRIVNERSRRGGFSQVEDLADLGIAPHVVVRLRELLTVDTTAPPPRRRGRIVDL